MAADVATGAGAGAVAARVAAAGRGCAGVVAGAGGIPAGTPTGGLAGIRQDWQALLGSNVLSAVLLVEALCALVEKTGGRVVLVSSVARCAAAAVAVMGR